MSPEPLFQIHLVLGYVAWFACFRIYLWPRLKVMPVPAAQRAIAMLHAFRFFGLVFILPGVVGPELPDRFATFAAYGDLATGVLALAAVIASAKRAWFWLFVIAFNIVGVVDLVGDYILATLGDLPTKSGQLGALYAIPILYVPLLMITHLAAFYLLGRRANG